MDARRRLGEESPKAKPESYDEVGQIRAWEAGELDDDDTIFLFQRLIDSGLVWKLQGTYGRTAARLIDQGLCHKAGGESVRDEAVEESPKAKPNDPPNLVWDTSQIAQDQIDDILQNPEEHEYVTGDRAEWDALSDEEKEKKASEEAYQDSGYQQMCWDDMCEALTEMMNEINPSGRWSGKVSNFGWRHQSGESKDIKATTGEELLQAVLPKTDCMFKIWNRKDHIEIDNAHHDAPTGGEMYEIYPYKEEEEDEPTEGRKKVRQRVSRLMNEGKESITGRGRPLSHSPTAALPRPKLRSRQAK